MGDALDEHFLLPVNGTELDVRIVGDRPRNPVILFLHGGPGFPNRHEVLTACRPLLPYATLVCYDQRGAGRSYRDDDRLSLSLLIDDAAAVTAYLHDRFPDAPMVLMGHSFGGMLAILLLQKVPLPFSGLIVSGLLTDVAENELGCYRFVTEEAARRGDLHASVRLSAVEPPAGGVYRRLADMETVAAYVRRYGGDRYGRHVGLFLSTILPLFSSREYRLSDFARYRRGIYLSTIALWREIAAVDLRKEAPALPVPLLVTGGKYDRNTPAEAAKPWYNTVEAPKKRWVEFPHSAHAPYVEEPALWCETVRAFLEEVTRSAEDDKEENEAI